ncbi:MAG: tRNA epoxyqueuosine(34) reductase QueG [Caulobacterales bacterium]
MEEARAQGFSQCGVASLDGPWTHGEDLRRFVELGFHGEMEWMADTLERRQHPTSMWGEAKSAIVLGLDYPPEHDPLAALLQKDQGVISAYAQNEDYHDIIKGRLKAIARWLQAQTQEDVKVFVDTAPLMEKPLAQAAGLGWIGKQTVLVSRQGGAWMFLGVVLTSAVLEPDASEQNHCGQCTACLDVCPTNAFPAPFQLDARRCISYLTIEHKGAIDVELRPLMGNRIYGCDDCLAVCPWNKFAAVGREVRLQTRDSLKDLSLADLANLDDAAFRTLFRKSPVKRIGRDRFIRNVMIAIGNSGDQALAASAEARLIDEAAEVRAMAVWALQRLAPDRLAALAPEHLPRERDADVRGEWAGILA